MEVAVGRLRSLLQWEQWITFVALGYSDNPKDYHLAEIRMLGGKLDVGSKRLDVVRILQTAGVSTSALVAEEAGYSVAAASPRETAQILDAIFRDHFGIRSFPGNGTDYPVGAEWRNEGDGFAA